MLSPSGCRTRRERLWQRIADDIEWILITDPAHQTYFSNYRPSPFVFNSQNAPAVLALGRGGEAILIADNVQEPFLEKSHVMEKLMPLWYRCIESAGDRRALVVETALDCM